MKSKPRNLSKSAAKKLSDEELEKLRPHLNRSCQGCGEDFNLSRKNPDKWRSFPDLCTPCRTEAEARARWRDRVNPECDTCRGRVKAIAVKGHDEAKARMHCPKCWRTLSYQPSSPHLFKRSRELGGVLSKRPVLPAKPVLAAS